MSIVFIWRGFGLIVPIIFGICAWIVSYWYDDTRLGNASYMGWTCFYASIVLLLPGLGMWGGTVDEDGTKRKHDFMFVPVLFWSLGLGGLCAYLLLTRDPEPAGNGNQTVQVADDEVRYDEVYRTVNFVNSSDDSLEVVVRNEKGEVDRFFVGPKKWESRDIEAAEYTFTSYALNGDKVFQLKDQKITEPEDTKKGYHAQWIQLDGGMHNMILLDVTELLPADFKRGDLEKVDWTSKIKTKYDAKGLMQPSFPADGGVNPRMLEPGDLIPSYTPKDQQVFALINVPADQELNNEYFVERLGAMYFE